jgi:hypothetical protein
MSKKIQKRPDFPVWFTRLTALPRGFENATILAASTVLAAPVRLRVRTVLLLKELQSLIEQLLGDPEVRPLEPVECVLQVEQLFGCGTLEDPDRADGIELSSDRLPVCPALVDQNQVGMKFERKAQSLRLARVEFRYWLDYRWSFYPEPGGRRCRKVSDCLRS